MLGSPLLYLKGMGILMFQLSGFYCRGLGVWGFRGSGVLGFRGLAFRVKGLGG